jgi:hypothetical protein
VGATASERRGRLEQPLRWAGAPYQGSGFFLLLGSLDLNPRYKLTSDTVARYSR